MGIVCSPNPADTDAVIARFRESGVGESGLALRALRSAVAAEILAMRPSDMPRIWSGPLGHAARAIADVDAFLLVPSQGDRQQTRAAAALMASARTDLSFLHGAIVGLMFAHASTLPMRLVLRNGSPEMQAYLTRQILRRPTFFLEESLVHAYVVFMERVFRELDARIARGEDPRGPTIAPLIAQHSLHAALTSGEDLVALMRARGRVLKAWTDRVHGGDAAGDYRPVRRADRRIRIGILVQHLEDRPNTYYVLAHYKGLDAEKFEVVLFVLRNAVDAEFEAMCVSHAALAVRLDGAPFAERIRRIRAAGCDMLLFGGNVVVGADPLAMLGGYRMAPVQVALGASPATTGLVEMDYFLTAESTEGPESDATYLERRMLLETTFCCFDPSFGMIEASLDIDRAAFGAGPDTPLFVSNANLTKLAPGVLRAWAEILRRAPDARLVLAPFNPFWVSTNAHRRLFESAVACIFADAGVDPERVKFVDTLETPAHVRRLIEICDIYLDSFPFSGCTSLLDPLRAHKPVVVRNGRVQRANQGAGMLWAVDMAELVAADDAAYVDIAVALAADLAGTRERTARHLGERIGRAPFLDPASFGRELGVAIARTLSPLTADA